MAKTFVHDCGAILFTATTTARVSGAVFTTAGTLPVVALVDIAAAGTGACAVDGVWTITKQTNAPWTLGRKLYYDTSPGNQITTVATSNTYAGRAWAAASTTAATGQINLNFGAA